MSYKLICGRCRKVIHVKDHELETCKYMRCICNGKFGVIVDGGDCRGIGELSRRIDPIDKAGLQAVLIEVDVVAWKRFEFLRTEGEAGLCVFGKKVVVKDYLRVWSDRQEKPCEK